jgi:hypothetical protein
VERRTNQRGPRRCCGLVYRFGPLWPARGGMDDGCEMAVLVGEDEGFDAAGAAVQHVLQTLGGEVEDAVAVGQPPAVEPLISRRAEGLFRLVELFRIGWLPTTLGDPAALVEMAAQGADQRRSERRGELRRDGRRMQFVQPLGPRRYDNAKGPRGHAPQQVEMALHKGVEGTHLGVRRQVQKNHTARRIDADRELLRDEWTGV